MGAHLMQQPFSMRARDCAENEVLEPTHRQAEDPPAIDAKPKPKPQLAWSRQEIDLLHELAAQGLRVAVIALRLGRSYASVTFRARREGIRFASFAHPPRPESGGPQSK